MTPGIDDLPYQRLNNTCSSTISKHYLNNLNSSDWQDYHGFDANFLNVAIWSQDPFLAKLNTHCDIEYVYILKMAPGTFYKWHKDSRRGAAINCLLQHQVSHCLFTEVNPYETKRKFPVHELVYEPDTYYIFDTQQWHCVINIQDFRYMLSVEFKADLTTLRYQDVVTCLSMM